MVQFMLDEIDCIKVMLNLVGDSRCITSVLSDTEYCCELLEAYEEMMLACCDL